MSFVVPFFFPQISFKERASVFARINRSETKRLIIGPELEVIGLFNLLDLVLSSTGQSGVVWWLTY